MSFRVPEQHRITAANIPHARVAPLVTDPHSGNNGAFLVPGPLCRMWCIASDERGWAEKLKGPPWEHVSVSVISQDRLPTWKEMCFIKGTFWDAEDCVVQFHPPQSEYVNCHPYVLHLWRPIGFELPRPDPFAVGPKS